MNLSRRGFLKTAGAAAIGLGATHWSIDAATYEPWLNSATKNELGDIAVALAKKLGATYADIRINRYRTERILTRERQVQNVSLDQTFGFGVRVLVNGGWGFAASSEVSPREVRRVAREAVAMARANAGRQPKPVQFLESPAVTTKWRSAFEQDPFEVPIEQKIEMLLKINEAALGVKGVGFVNSSMSWVNEQKFYASTDGSRIEQFIIRGWPDFTVTAVDRAAGDFQTRNSLGGPQGMGYEYMRHHDWVQEAGTAGEEAAMKLRAKRVTPGKYDLVLHPTHLWLTIHESVGHSTELDRALGWEANFAGTSFLTPDKTGKVQFGAKPVNFFADRIQPAGLATVGYDDEGVPGQKWYLVKDGIFVDWQTTRDLAPLIGRNASYGCLHAQSWSDVPFARMPNVSLEPAKEDVALDQLVGGVDNGILIYGNGSFSIDQQRYNFQFGGQTFWEIKQGRITGMLRDVAYQSRTTDFWNSCDGLGGPATYALGGSFNDGKGEPSQSSAVSHGCPVARFRNVNVLNTDSKHGGGARNPRMLTEREARKICDSLLKLSKAEDAVVSVRESIEGNQRFAANAFTTNGSSRSRSFSITVWIDRRQGSVSGTEFDEAALRRAVEQAENLARLAPVSPEYMPTLGPQKYKPVSGFVSDTADISPTWRAKQIGSIFDRCDAAGVVGAGLFRSGAFTTASATRHGNFQFERTTDVSLSMTARMPDGTSSGFALHNHFDLGRLDIAGVAQRAVDKALTGRDARRIEPGVYPVILEPQAVGDILGFFHSAFDARSADEGRSPLSASGGQTLLGQPVFDSKLSFHSDPWHRELPGSSSAQDGLPAEKLHLVRNGVVENLINSRFWAEKMGRKPTPGPVNLILESAGQTSSLTEMIAESKRALLLTRLWYIRMVNPRTQLLTGLTRDGVWLVENGKIKHPVRNFRFNQSVMAMLAAGNVEMLGPSERVGGRDGRGASLFPALKLRAFTFSSESDAV